MIPTKLADLICKKILLTGEMSFEDIEARAIEKGIDLDTLDQALELVHKRPKIEAVELAAGTIYRKRKIVKSSPFAATEWINKNYPKMTPENDGHGIEADYSYLFLSPEEMKEYKIQLKGGWQPQPKGKFKQRS